MDRSRELFTDENSGLGLEDGLEILECDGLSMEKDGNSVKLQTLGSGGGRLELSLRSGEMGQMSRNRGSGSGPFLMEMVIAPDFLCFVWLYACLLL